MFKITAAAEPVPAMVLITLPFDPVKVTSIEEEASPLTVTTPPTCVASPAVAPSPTPVPSAKTGASGTSVSSVIETLVAAPA